MCQNGMYQPEVLCLEYFNWTKFGRNHMQLSGTFYGQNVCAKWMTLETVGSEGSLPSNATINWFMPCIPFAFGLSMRKVVWTQAVQIGEGDLLFVFSILYEIEIKLSRIDLLTSSLAIFCVRIFGKWSCHIGIVDIFIPFDVLFSPNVRYHSSIVNGSPERKLGR